MLSGVALVAFVTISFVVRKIYYAVNPEKRPRKRRGE
jgi:hypothetical protein